MAGGVVDLALQIVTGKALASLAIKGTKLTASTIQTLGNLNKAQKAAMSSTKAVKWYDDIAKYGSKAANEFNRVALRNARQTNKFYFAAYAASDAYENALANICLNNN